MGPRTRRPLAARLERLRQWWWDQDRRRHIWEMERRDEELRDDRRHLDEERRDDRHLLDEDYILDAFARQLEEIRKLPEFAV